MTLKIGYPCLNRSIGCTGSKTFRLRNYSPERMRETVAHNLSCQEKMLAYNADHGLLYFRISSDLVPFASHPVCTFDWKKEFGTVLRGLGTFIASHGMRIAMHPDQFILLNALDPEIVRSSVAELNYHAQVLDAMRLDHTAKIQIHVGGVYGDRPAAMARFIRTFKKLPVAVRRRLVIENDDVRYPLADCLAIHDATGIPVLFDEFHHRVLGDGRATHTALKKAASTWRKADGLPLVDYSSQKKDGRKGAHTDAIDPDDFKRFLKASRPADFDLMLEIKDKEKSAVRALELARRDKRLLMERQTAESR